MMFQDHSLPLLTGSNIPSMPFVRRLENDGGLLENKSLTLTTDHGGESTSNNFQQWLRQHGIFHLTAPREEPNYNAVIERASYVVETMAFAMMMHANKPKTWWHWAFNWATYVLDRCSRRSNVNSITPFEAFFGSLPDLADIRIFGCICFPLVLPSQHKHLTPRAQRGVFIGVNEERISRGAGWHAYIYGSSVSYVL